MKYKVGDIVVVKGIRPIAGEAVYGWMGTGSNIGIMLEDIVCFQGEELLSYKTTVDSKYRF